MIFSLFAWRVCSAEEPLPAPEAFAQGPASDPKAHLVLVGEGVLREQLEEQAKSLGWQAKSTSSGYVPIFRTCWAQWMFLC